MKRLFYFVAAVLLSCGPLPVARATNSDPSNVASTRPNEDEDQDGLTNQEEAEFGTYPYNAYSDTDSVKDGEDGWALDGILAPPRSPKVSYAVVLLPPTSEMDSPILGDGGHVVLQQNRSFFLWYGGQISTLPIPTANYQGSENPESVTSINSNGDVVGTVMNHGFESYLMDTFMIPFGATAGTVLPRLHQRIIEEGDDTYASYSAPLISNDGRIFDFYSGNNREGNSVQCGVIWTNGIPAQYGGKLTATGTPFSVIQDGPLIAPKAVNINGVCAGEYALGLDQDLEFQERGCGIWNGSLFKADTNHNRSRLEDITKDNHALGYINYGTSFYAAVWVFNNGTWTPRQIPNYITRINDDMLGVAGTSLWKNDKYIQKEDLVSRTGFLVNYLYDINNSGVILCNVTDNQINKNALLVPVSLKDVKKTGTEDDDVVLETIPPKKSGESENAYIQRALSDKQIAYIEPHGAANDTDPEMPHLVAKLPGGPHGLKVKWKLVVEYKRGNGYRAPYVNDFTRPEDTVKIPTSGGYTAEMDADQEWRIFESEDWTNELAGNGFFGGTAKLYLWFPSQGAEPTEPIYTFRIGGKNPDPAKAKTFINSTAGSQFWYAYAIAKHETYGRVRENGSIRFYNQFYTNYKGGPIGDASVDMGWAAWAKGWPLYNLDRGKKKDGTRYQNGPGGYGMYQLTLGPKLPDATIPAGGEAFITRAQVWNWQENVRGAINELQGKLSAAQSLQNGLHATYSQWPSIPNEGHLSGLDAIVVTYYNGTGGLPSRRVGGSTKRTPWTPELQGSTRTWKFHQNSQDYVQSVNGQIE